MNNLDTLLLEYQNGNRELDFLENLVSDLSNHNLNSFKNIILVGDAIESNLLKSLLNIGKCFLLVNKELNNKELLNINRDNLYKKHYSNNNFSSSLSSIMKKCNKEETIIIFSDSKVKLFDELKKQSSDIPIILYKGNILNDLISNNLNKVLNNSFEINKNLDYIKKNVNWIIESNIDDYFTSKAIKHIDKITYFNNSLDNNHNLVKLLNYTFNLQKLNLNDLNNLSLDINLNELSNLKEEDLDILSIIYNFNIFNDYTIFKNAYDVNKNELFLQAYISNLILNNNYEEAIYFSFKLDTLSDLIKKEIMYMYLNKDIDTAINLINLYTNNFYFIFDKEDLNLYFYSLYQFEFWNYNDAMKHYFSMINSNSIYSSSPITLRNLAFLLHKHKKAQASYFYNEYKNQLKNININF